MFIYNITTHVSWSVHDRWMQWKREEYIPAMLKTGYFVESKMLRILDVDDSEGPTYAIQFTVMTISNYKLFIEKHQEFFRNKLQKKWGDDVVTFESIMEVLH